MARCNIGNVYILAIFFFLKVFFVNLDEAVYKMHNVQKQIPGQKRER